MCVCMYLYSFDFSIYKITLSVNRDSFTPSFSFWMHFTSFPYLIALAIISTIMLNRSGENRCLFTDDLVFISKNYVGMGFLQIPFIRLKKFPSILSLWCSFIMKRYWTWSSSTSIEVMMWFKKNSFPLTDFWMSSNLAFWRKIPLDLGV